MALSPVYDAVPMVEVAKVVVLPAPGLADQIQELMTLLLVWEVVEVPADLHSADQQTLVEQLTPLIDQGLVRIARQPLLGSDTKRLNNEMRRRGLPFRVDLSDKEVEELARQAADLYVAAQVQDAKNALRSANERGLAAIALNPIASAAVSLPEVVPQESAAESALIQAAISGITVLPDTSIEDVLAFRDKNGALMGRFRGAMVDLAAALNRNAPPAALAAQADAVITNRVEPVLADLETVLSRNRIGYAWSVMLGASTVALGPAAPIAAVGVGGRIISQSLSYAFDRRKLVSEHPYGLLHVVRSDIAGPSERKPAPIIDPLDASREAFAAGWTAGHKYRRDRHS